MYLYCTMASGHGTSTCEPSFFLRNTLCCAVGWLFGHALRKLVEVECPFDYRKVCRRLVVAGVKNSLNTPSMVAESEHTGPTDCVNSHTVTAAVLLDHFRVPYL